MSDLRYKVEGKKTERQSNIELLRILSMLMIVFYHFAVHGNFNWKGIGITMPHLWYNLIYMGGKVGVDIFVLISGYFLILNDNKIFDFKRLLKFWGPVFLYSVGIGLLFILFGTSNYDIKNIIKLLFPITYGEWWFASTYFVLYLIHPFLNVFLNELEKKRYQSLIVLLVIIWSIIPTFSTSLYQSNNLLWFITLYIIAGYIRLYGFNKEYTTKKYFELWILFSILTYLTTVIFTILGEKWVFFFNHTYHFYSQEKISTLLMSLTLFMTFVTLKINYHKSINMIASATFGVYLIHDNNFVRPFLWEVLFENVKYQSSILLIPYSIVVCVILYAICTLIDLLRQKILEKPFNKLVDRYVDNILNPFEKITIIFRKIIFGSK